MNELLIEPRSFLETLLGHLLRVSSLGGLVKIEMSEAHPDLQNQSLGCGVQGICVFEMMPR